jgi:hypothetical protein
MVKAADMSGPQRLAAVGTVLWTLPKRPRLLATLIAVCGGALTVAVVFGEPWNAVAFFTAMPITVLVLTRAIDA